MLGMVPKTNVPRELGAKHNITMQYFAHTACVVSSLVSVPDLTRAIPCQDAIRPQTFVPSIAAGAALACIISCRVLQMKLLVWWHPFSLM